MDTQETQYWVDAQDRIIEVSSHWDQFAEDNDGADMCARRVLGRSLWDFITGEATQIWLRSLLQLVRVTREPVIRQYRCDSPTLKRYMKMLLLPQHNDIVEVRHVLLKEQAMAVRVDIEAVQPWQKAFLKRCSICNRIEHHQQWLEPDVAKQHKELENQTALRVIYAICPDCKQQLPHRHSAAIPPSKA